MRSYRRALIAAVLASSAGASSLSFADVTTIQTLYADTHGANGVLVRWEPASAPVTVLVDGAAVADVAAEVDSHTVSSLSVGAHDIEVRADGESLGSAAQNVVSAAFFAAAAIICSSAEDDEECEIEIGGESEGPPPTVYEVWIDGELRDEVSGFDLVVEGPLTYRYPVLTSGFHRVEFIGRVDSGDPFWGQTGSFLGESVTTSCATDCGVEVRRFRAGAADGRAVVDVSTAIFLLDFLFAGGSEPPCLEAADANEDGATDVADPVFLLLHLFSGGVPPSSWRDIDGDGNPDPSCRSGSIERCAASHADC